MRTLLLLAVLFGGLYVPAQAQTIWSRPYEPNQIVLETLVPELPNDDASALSGATFLTITRSYNKNLELVAELPVARYATDTTSTTAVGNPYVGVGFASTSRPILFELGVRIPAVPSNRARRAGQRADLGRTAAFRDEAFATTAFLNGRFSVGRRTSLRLRGGLTYASAEADSADGTENRWRLPYSAQLWRDGRQFMIGLSIVGRPAISGPDGARSTHRAVFSLMLDWDRVQPGLLVGTGLDPLLNDSEFVLVGGLTLSISYAQ
jgi:hypothetical protein